MTHPLRPYLCRCRSRVEQCITTPVCQIFLEACCSQPLSRASPFHLAAISKLHLNRINMRIPENILLYSYSCLLFCHFYSARQLIKKFYFQVNECKIQIMQILLLIFSSEIAYHIFLIL